MLTYEAEEQGKQGKAEGGQRGDRGGRTNPTPYAQPRGRGGAEGGARRGEGMGIRKAYPDEAGVALRTVKAQSMTTVSESQREANTKLDLGSVKLPLERKAGRGDGRKRRRRGGGVRRASELALALPTASRRRATQNDASGQVQQP